MDNFQNFLEIKGANKKVQLDFKAINYLSNFFKNFVLTA